MSCALTRTCSSRRPFGRCLRADSARPVRDRSFLASATTGPAVGEARMARNDEQPFDPRESGDDLVDETVDEIVLVAGPRSGWRKAATASDVLPGRASGEVGRCRRRRGLPSRPSGRHSDSRGAAASRSIPRRRPRRMPGARPRFGRSDCCPRPPAPATRRRTARPWKPVCLRTPDSIRSSATARWPKTIGWPSRSRISPSVSSRNGPNSYVVAMDRSPLFGNILQLFRSDFTT